MYDQLHGFAHSLMTHYPCDRSLQARSLVHEAFLRLGSPDKTQWNGRGHFFAAAAIAMRRILVEKMRRKNSLKRGGQMTRIELQSNHASIPHLDLDLLALDEALEELKAKDERKAKVVMLRFVNGLTIRETAVALEISSSTVERDWKFARAFLFARLDEKPHDADHRHRGKSPSASSRG